MKLLYNDDVLPEGKYKGKTVQEIIELDPQYIKHWNNGNWIGTNRKIVKWQGQYAIADITLESIKASKI